MLGFGCLLFVFVAWCLWGAYLSKTWNDRSAHYAGAAVVVIVALLLTIIPWANDIGYHSDIARQERNIIVHQDRTKDMLPAILSVLSTYPPHERAIFEKYVRGQGGFIMLPPQLQANTTIMKAAAEVRNIRDKVYTARLAISEDRARIRNNAYGGRLYAICVPRLSEKE